MEAILHDGELFINQTIEELQYLLVQNFNETQGILEDTLTQIEADFGEFKNNTIAEIELDKLKNTADQFVEIVDEFNTLVGSINDIKSVQNR